MITHVAIKVGDEWFSLPKPFRHHNVMKEYRRIFNVSPFPIPHVQGFLDENGNFLDRIEAAEYALSCGQITKLEDPPELFSEDLWS